MNITLSTLCVKMDYPFQVFLLLPFCILVWQKPGFCKYPLKGNVNRISNFEDKFISLFTYTHININTV